MSMEDTPSTSPPLPTPRKTRTPSSLTPLYLIKQDKLPGYAIFKLNQGFSKYIIAICFLKMVYFMFGAVSIHMYNIPVPLQLATTFMLFIPLIEWTYLYHFHRYTHSDTMTAEGRRIFLFGNLSLVVKAVCMSLVIFAWVHARHSCDIDLCVQQFDEKSLPLGWVMAVMGSSIADPLLYHCHCASVCFLSRILLFVALFVAAVLLDTDKRDLMFIVVVGIVIVYVLVINQGSQFLLYKSFAELETVLRVNIEIENKEHLMKLENEQMRHMIGNVAHDLRTPLQAFQSEMEILRDKIKTEKHNETSFLSSIDQLDSICNFMNMTINRSIDYTKASSGLKLNPSIESVNFSETMKWAVGCMVQSDAKVPIVILPIPDAIHNQLYTDKQWLMENVLCLLSNALKFTTEGQITIRCSLQGSVVQPSKKHIRAASSESQSTDIVSDIETGISISDFHVDDAAYIGDKSQMILIEVEDTGIGISKENQGRLFKPFMQAQRRTGGTGLGLYALSKRLESLGGNCGVRDRSDGASGSCFWISIPFKPDKVDSTSVQKFSSIPNKSSSSSLVSLMSGFIEQSKSHRELSNTTDRSPSTDETFPPLKILLVDDSNLIQKTTSRSLIKAGHQVEIAQHGAECLKMLEESQTSPFAYAYDLILMDLQMPVMDGLEATRRIRALEKSVMPEGSESSVPPHITIIGVTANTEGEARTDCMKCGMDGYLEKPLKIAHLHEYILSDPNFKCGPGGRGGGSRRM